MVCLERTNARYLSTEQIPEALDFASIDVSFISLKLIFPALYALLREGGEVACLIKPQFEAGREKVGKKGVVTRQYTWKCWRTSCVMQRKITLQFLVLHILLSAGRREISSTSAI